jgi:SAM-dependent methyltransferase
MPDAETLSVFYDSDYHCYHSSPLDHARLDQWIAERRSGEFCNHVRVVPGGRYLDVGCGTGDMVAAMARLGMHAEGVEPSPAAVAIARQAGLQVFQGFLHDAALPAASFDSISMFHSLEHTERPLEVMRECRRILKPGGELLIGVPNIDSLVFATVGDGWIGLQLPTHLQHFSVASVIGIANRAGLQPVAVFTESLLPHVESELQAYLRRRFRVPGRVSARLPMVRQWAGRLARRGEQSNRGEAIVARLRA